MDWGISGIMPMFVASSDGLRIGLDLGLRSLSSLTLGFIGLSPLATTADRPFHFRVAAYRPYPRLYRSVAVGDSGITLAQRG